MPNILNLHTPLNFGKYMGLSPFDVWTGAPGHVSPELAVEILNTEVSIQDHKTPLHRALCKANVDRTKFLFQLSSDFPIAKFRKMIGEDDVNLAFGEEQITYINKYRGEPSYIMWLIDETE